MEAIVFSGVQGSGKTTFYAQRFLQTHVRISRDLLRTPARETAFLHLCLTTRQRLVVDKTNPTVSERAPYVESARQAGFRVVAYVFSVSARDAIGRVAARTTQAAVPIPGILGTMKRLRPPTYEEGFDEIFVVRAAPGLSFEVEPVERQS